MQAEAEKLVGQGGGGRRGKDPGQLVPFSFRFVCAYAVSLALAHSYLYRSQVARGGGSVVGRLSVLYQCVSIGYILALSLT